MANANGRSKWVALPLGVIIVGIGLLVTYGQTRGSESATIKTLGTSMVSLEERVEKHDKLLADMAKSIAVIERDVHWIRKDAENDE